MIDIVKRESCYGCMSCSQVCPVKCIEKAADEEGFYIPILNKSKCIKCQKCMQVCPALQENDVKKIEKVFAAINKDGGVLEKSTSGGVFSVLANLVISSQGIVYGAAFDADNKVIHVAVDKIDEIPKLQGSKYVQSDMSSVYASVQSELNKERLILFTGTPCQNAALALFLGKKYSNLFCVDFICHGIPSPLLLSQYLKFINFKKNKKGLPLENINFRSKNISWQKPTVLISCEKRKIYQKQNKRDPYYIAFQSDNCLRYSCYNCKYRGGKRYSDLTISDFWGVEKVGVKLFDKLGVSAVFINTESGELFFEKMKKYLYYEETSLNCATEFNKSYYYSPILPNTRKGFYKNLNVKHFNKTINQKCGITNYSIFKYEISQFITNSFVWKVLKGWLK